jgi:aryl-alcohol dehydrogenase-like predicted oxidoreductase
MSMVQMALRWILDHEAVSVVIPGASSPAQAEANARVSALPPLPETLHQELSAFYKERVHAHIRGPY